MTFRPPPPPEPSVEVKVVFDAPTLLRVLQHQGLIPDDVEDVRMPALRVVYKRLYDKQGNFDRLTPWATDTDTLPSVEAIRDDLPPFDEEDGS